MIDDKDVRIVLAPSNSFKPTVHMLKHAVGSIIVELYVLNSDISSKLGYK